MLPARLWTLWGLLPRTGAYWLAALLYGGLGNQNLLAAPAADNPRDPSPELRALTLTPPEVPAPSPDSGDASKPLGHADADLPLARPPKQPPTPSHPRPKPDEARGYAVPPKPPPEHQALWIPRAVAYPFNLVFKALFFPIRKLLRAGKGNFVPYARRAFFWNRAGTLGWLPHASFFRDFGLTYGLRVFHNNLFGTRERLQAKALFGGVFAQRYQLRFEADRLAATPVWLDVRLRYERNPVLIFRGIGILDDAPPEATGLGPRQGDAFTRYSQERFLAYARGGYTFGPPKRQVRIGGQVLFNHRDFGGRQRTRTNIASGDTDQPSIEEIYDVSAVPGFEDTINLTELQAVMELDFRNAAGRPSRGFFAEVFAGGAPTVGGYGYGHYGVEVTKYINLYKDTRIVVLRGSIEAMHGRDRAIPFSDLVTLGGVQKLRGYPRGRFRDKLGALGTIEYRYPIHQLLQGHLFVDAGRVGRDYPDLFAGHPRDWRFGFGGGLTARSVRRVWLRLELAYGDRFWVGFSLYPLQAFRNRSKQL